MWSRGREGGYVIGAGYGYSSTKPAAERAHPVVVGTSLAVAVVVAAAAGGRRPWSRTSVFNEERASKPVRIRLALRWTAIRNRK